MGLLRLARMNHSELEEGERLVYHLSSRPQTMRMQAGMFLISFLLFVLLMHSRVGVIMRGDHRGGGNIRA